MDLAPLADMLPASVTPEFSPLTTDQAASLSSLQPNSQPYALQDSDLGIRVDSRALLGEAEIPRPTTAATTTTTAAPRPTKIKLKLK